MCEFKRLSFTLQENMNSNSNNPNSMTTASLNPQQLELGKPEQYIPKVPVSDTLPRYHQTISYGGCKLNIQVPASELFALIYSNKSMYGDAVLVPVSKWLKQQFELINMFVERNACIPNELSMQWSVNLPSYYKPIYDGHNIFISMSKFCRFTEEVNGNLIDLPCQPRPNFGKGLYSFTIEVPYVYIGPHQAGHLYTTQLRVTRIHFQSIASDVPSTLVQNYSMPVSLPQSVNTSVNQSLPVSQTSAPMDIGPNRVVSMSGILPCEASKPKRRRKAVVSE